MNNAQALSHRRTHALQYFTSDLADHGKNNRFDRPQSDTPCSSSGIQFGAKTRPKSGQNLPAPPTIQNQSSSAWVIIKTRAKINIATCRECVQRISVQALAPQLPRTRSTYRRPSADGYRLMSATDPMWCCFVSLTQTALIRPRPV